MSFLEVCTWTLTLSAVARSRGWEVWEPISLETGFNLLTEAGQREAFEYIQHAQPSMLAFAWPCTYWSCLQNLNVGKRKDEATYRKERERHRTMMLPFVRRCALFQLERGNHFFGENPLTSLAFQEPPIRDIMNRMHVVEVDMCVHGLCCPETGQPIKKPTAILTTSDEVAKLLLQQGREGRCQCGWGEHRPVVGSVRVWDPYRQQTRSVQLSSFCGGYTKQFAELVVDGYSDDLQLEVYVSSEFTNKRKQIDASEMMPISLSTRRR